MDRLSITSCECCFELCFFRVLKNRPHELMLGAFCIHIHLFNGKDGQESRFGRRIAIDPHPDLTVSFSPLAISSSMMPCIYSLPDFYAEGWKMKQGNQKVEVKWEIYSCSGILLELDGCIIDACIIFSLDARFSIRIKKVQLLIPFPRFIRREERRGRRKCLSNQRKRMTRAGGAVKIDFNHKTPGMYRIGMRFWL